MAPRLALALALLLVTRCGLRSGGRRLPDGGSFGTAAGCNRELADGNRVLDPDAAPFANINALSFDRDGRLYVLSRTSTASYVAVFGPSPDHDFERVLGRGVLHDGVDFKRDTDGSLWVLEDKATPSADPEVVHLSAEGARLSGFNVTTDEPGGLAIAPDGTLYVSVGRIARFSREGMVMKVFGSKDPLIPLYQGLTFDARGRLWATEPNERTLEQFDAEGARLGSHGGHGPELGKFDANTDVHGGPTDVTVDANGDLYVNDPLGSRIQKFSRVGDPVAQFRFGTATNIEPVAIDPLTGNVYVGRDTAVDIVCPL